MRRSEGSRLVQELYVRVVGFMLTSPVFGFIQVAIHTKIVGGLSLEGYQLCTLGLFPFGSA